ncbi:hypothetical protein QQF64_012984 [Cirrhinus molitorella]|uniref:Nurim n=1 Tax=Cirrhinus molitorella TaxID=172907 RepID=A0ABR3LPU4_9TELE
MHFRISSDEISVKIGEELLVSDADKVQHQNRITERKEDWSRSEVQSERMTVSDGNQIIYGQYMDSAAETYIVLDSEGETLITIKLRAFLLLLVMDQNFIVGLLLIVVLILLAVKINKILRCLNTALITFVFVFVTGADFVRFVSFRAIYHNLSGAAPLCRDSVPWSVALRDGVVLKAVAVDVFLLVLFSLQHSLLAWAPVKSVCQNVFGVLSRTVYCFTTAAALQILMHYWHPVTSAPCLWSVRNAPWDIWFPLICFILHFLCWAIICSILLIFDYPELLGIKQVYYECLCLGDPLLLKSERAQRLYSHLRHPVCVELLTVLWVLPTFPLDRLILAVYLSVYLILAHSLDNQDCAYLRRQLRNKLQLFSAPLEDSDQSNNNMHKQD